MTLGNALRRVLLSSLQGAAITAVRINGVLHEFSTIPGVMEDVSDIILNLKEVRLRMHAEGPKTLRVHKKGEGVLTAGDLVVGGLRRRGHEPGPQDRHARPPRRTSRWRLTVGPGKGYVPRREEQDRGHADRDDSDRLGLLARSQRSTTR